MGITFLIHNSLGHKGKLPKTDAETSNKTGIAKVEAEPPDCFPSHQRAAVSKPFSLRSVHYAWKRDLRSKATTVKGGGGGGPPPEELKTSPAGTLLHSPVPPLPFF